MPNQMANRKFQALNRRPWSAVLRTKLFYFLVQFPSLAERNIMRLREYLATQWSTPVQDPDLEEKDVPYETRDKVELRLRVYRPAKPASPGPLIVLYHGGGWIMGVPENMGSLARRLVKKFNAVCVAPQYRLAPEHPFPTGIDDTYDALKWVAAHAAELGADPSKGFLVGGQSAGGTSSAVAALLARDEGLLPKLTGVYIAAAGLLPANRVPDEYKSRYISQSQPACLQDPLSPAAMRKLFSDAAAADTSDRRAAPFLWPSGHQNLPRCYHQVCGLDVNRDENILYEELLRKNGVQTRINVYPGLSHVWWSAYPQLDVSKKWAEDTSSGFEWLLEAQSKASL